MGDSPFFIQAALSYLVGFLLAVGFISLLRERAAVTPQHAVRAVLLLALALISGGAVAVLSVIDELTADPGAQNQSSDHVTLAFLLVFCTLGATTVGVLVDGLSACRRMEPGLRAVVGLVIGALASPLIWLSITFFGFAQIAMIIPLIVSARLRPALGPYPMAPPDSYPPGPHPVLSLPDGVRRLSDRRITWIRLLAVSAVVVGAGAVAWAVADRAAGAASAYIAFIPLVAAVALWVSGRRPSTTISTCGPALLAGVSAIGFAATTWSPQLREEFVVAPVSALCGGVALAWTLLVWLPGDRTSKVLVGAGAGMVYLIFMTLSTVMFTQYFLFSFVAVLTPAYGLIILRRPPASDPPAPPPAPGPAAPAHWTQP
ncbi:hypothetical protein [Actinomyces sp. ZJ308]|uniref:hypothetical protein n=1 Tax=Actinomyces sp. ZJ308 TaxID=2708342 RepID=UPI001421E4EF|nr:hypothetical protein [Actinomyces sp. ZJ308]